MGDLIQFRPRSNQKADRAFLAELSSIIEHSVTVTNDDQWKFDDQTMAWLPASPPPKDSA